MKTLKLKFRHQNVYKLSKKLISLGYKIKANSLFDKRLEVTVKDFQKRNDLPVTGEVDDGTWKKIEMKLTERTFITSQLLSHDNILAIANKYSTSVSKMKKMLETIGNRNAFLRDGRPTITFYPSQFWKELQKRGIDPEQFYDKRKPYLLSQIPSLDKKTTNDIEYHRLEAASTIASIPGIQEAAYCATAWGRFQIMGFEYDLLGLPSVFYLTSSLYRHESEHLDLFVKLLHKENLLTVLQKKSFDEFHNAYKRKDLLSSEFDKNIVFRNNNFLYR